jgi:hypothetical protein
MPPAIALISHRQRFEIGMEAGRRDVERVLGRRSASCHQHFPWSLVTH